MKKLLAFLFLLISVSSFAQTVKVVIPFPPGGGTDTAFKHYQKYVGEKHNITLVPVYKPGAESLIGLTELAESPGDGSVIGIATIAGLATHRLKNPDYQFDYISLLGKTTMAVVASTNSGLRTLTDLEKEIKNNPTRKNYGYGAPAQKVALVQLFTSNNTTVPTLVPYKGAAPLINDLLGGHIDVAIVPLSTVKSQIDSGKLTLIASTSKQYGTYLKQRYTHWESHEGFVLTLPKNSDRIAVQRWVDITKGYLSDNDTEKYWADKFLEGSSFGANFVKADVDSAMKQSN